MYEFGRHNLGPSNQFTIPLIPPVTAPSSPLSGWEFVNERAWCQYLFLPESVCLSVKHTHSVLPPGGTDCQSSVSTWHKVPGA